MNELLEKFSKKYYSLLTEDFSGINLTRITDWDDFQNKQIKDSIAPYDQIAFFKDKMEEDSLKVDVGFGGGFPLLPMAFTLPKRKFLGIETRRKKVDVVSQISDELKLKNVSFLHSRIEGTLFDIESVITLKAVGKVYDFLSKINTTKKVTVFFYKGPGFYEQESDQIKKASKNWDIVCEEELIVPFTEKRIIIGFQNKNVLHGTKKTNDLVKISQFK